MTCGRANPSNARRAYLHRPATVGAMTIELAAGLLILALIDSTSFGTLLIPLWLMLSAGRLAPGRTLLFLAVVAGCYFLLGVALVAGLETLLQVGNGWADHPLVVRGQFVLGAGLLVGSFFIGGKNKKDNPGQGRLMRWRDRATGEGNATGSLVTLALGAVVLEVATMLPYLGAIGLLSTSELGPATRVGALALYCVVMVTPALLLLGVRLVLRNRITGTLQRFSGWMERNAAEATGWIVGIVGFLLARDALARMPDLLGFLQGLG